MVELGFHGRALALLRKCLTESQRQSMDKHGYFIVKGSLGGEYQIGTVGITGNVMQLSGEIHVPHKPYWYYRTLPKSWCAYLPNCPEPDTWLAQKLLIETDEKQWQSIAL